jgi:integrase
MMDAMGTEKKRTRRNHSPALKAQPLWHELHAWMKLERTRVPDGGGIAAALDYSLRRWTALGRFLEWVTVHRLRHTIAMDLLQAGVDRSVIALWLGHESVETTQIYLEATLAMKEQALAKTSPPQGKSVRYQQTDQLLGFLNSL